MDEKVMEVLAKILEGQYDLRNELKQEIRVVSTKVDKLEMRMEEVSTKVDKLEMRVEYEVIDKIKIVFDAREVQNDSITNISDTLNRVEAKLEVLQLETAHIRRVK